jgi:mediator of RNA polymerase II transcription subunit 7
LRLGEADSSILGGVAAEEEEDGDVVAVFGEIVEDPLLIEPLDVCEDPTVIRDEVKRLNQLVLRGFVKLVQDLVHNPTENK